MNAPKYGLLFACLLWSASWAQAALITAIGGTPLDVSGPWVVGSANGAFLYNTVMKTRTSYSQYDFAGIDGNNVVGNVRSTGIGFKLDLSSGVLTTFSNPFAPLGAWGFEDIYGTKLIGVYFDTAQISHGFVYDSTLNTWAKLDYPGATAGTSLRGIWENKIVGLAYGIGGVLYDLDSRQWSLLPLEPNGISGNNIAGWRSGPPTFGSTVYNLATGTYFNPLKTAQVPAGQLVTGFEVNDYSNGIAVGTYSYFDGRFNRSTGYIYVVPEASTLLLAGIALAAGIVLQIRRREIARPRKRGLAPSPSNV